MTGSGLRCKPWPPSCRGCSPSRAPHTKVTVTLVVAYLILAAAYIAAGALSQMTGRRPFLIVVGVIMAIVATGLYYVLVRRRPKRLSG